MRTHDSCPKYTFHFIISQPIAYNPHLHGCLGAPVRENDDILRTERLHHRATTIKLVRTPTAALNLASHEQHMRLSRLAERGVTHVYDLLTGLAPREELRLKTPHELSFAGASGRRGRLPVWICSELLAAVPTAQREIIRDAAAFKRTHPFCPLDVLCRLLPPPKDSWVRVCTEPLGNVWQVIDVMPSDPLPPCPGHPHGTPTPHTLELSSPHVALRDGTLIPDPTRPPMISAGCHLTEPVLVWQTTRLAHCEQERESDERANDEDAKPLVLLYGGPVLDRYKLFGDVTAPSPRSDPSLLVLSQHQTDRQRNPLNAATIDVFSLYHLQLSFAWVVPRALSSLTAPSDTSTCWAHHPSISPLTQKDRASMCRALHPNARHGRSIMHSLYMTAMDARPLGNARCCKPGPTRMLCDICWNVDFHTAHERARHLLLDCPYSRLAIDPFLRAILAVHSDDPSSIYDTPSSALYDSVSSMLMSGATIHDLPIATDVAPNIAGCISRAIFARAHANAPTADRPPCAVAFDAADLYARFVSQLSERAKHTFRYATACDDRLRILHPGIEEWLTDNGFVFEWFKAWGRLSSSDGDLSIPKTIHDAYVGCTGVRGVTCLPLHVCSRVSVYSAPSSQPRVVLRLSVGRIVGDTRGGATTDPSHHNWPLRADATPEYPIDCILAERTTRDRGTIYKVRWQHHTQQTTWEPESHVIDTLALERWQLRPEGEFTVCVRVDAARLSSLLALDLPVHRLHNLRALERARDHHNVIRFQPMHPSSAGGVVGGRTTYRDIHGKGNTFLTCNADARSFLFGSFYHELDISRSHITSTFGCYTLTGRPRPISLLRFIDEQEEFEADLARELRHAEPLLVREHDDAVRTAGASPDERAQKKIAWAAKAVRKCTLKPKTVLSAMINAPNLNSWRVPFSHCPCLTQLVRDIDDMRMSVPQHPLCQALDAALTADGVSPLRRVSICLAHLDDQALDAASAALIAAGCVIGPTVNDSITFRCDITISPAELERIATDAATARVGYQLSFTFNPHLHKRDCSTPTLDELRTTLRAVSPSSDCSDSDGDSDGGDDAADHDCSDDDGVHGADDGHAPPCCLSPPLSLPSSRASLSSPSSPALPTCTSAPDVDLLPDLHAPSHPPPPRSSPFDCPPTPSGFAPLAFIPPPAERVPYFFVPPALHKAAARRPPQPHPMPVLHRPIPIRTVTAAAPPARELPGTRAAAHTSHRGAALEPGPGEDLAPRRDPQGPGMAQDTAMRERPGTRGAWSSIHAAVGVVCSTVSGVLTRLWGRLL